MPEFSYQAKDGPGRTVHGVIEAPSETAALEKISAMGYAPLQVKTEGVAAPEVLDQRRSLRSARSKGRQLITFSRHLSSFLRNGVPILKALQIMILQERDGSFKQMLESIQQDLQEGQSLSKSLERLPHTFPTFYIAMVRAGEKGSALEQTLLILGDYLKKVDQTRRALRQAMTYPLFLSVAGLGTTMFILTFVVPKLSLLYENAQGQLPLITQVVMSLGDFMKWGWISIVAIILGVFYGIPYYLRKRIGENSWSATVMNFPYIGDLLFKTDFARFSRALQMSLANGIPFLQSLAVATPIMSLAHLREVMNEVSDRVKEGSYFGLSLKAHAIIPAFVSDMIVVGEESGNLEAVLSDIANTYEEESDEKMKYLTTLLEPLMILIIGSIVGFIVIAMLLPVFDMNILDFK